MEYITRHIGGMAQKYTQSGGVRPYGISCLIMGFDPNDPTPRLYQTEPSGIFYSWKACAIGRSAKTVREFLEKNYKDQMSKEDTIKLAVKSLLEVVQTGAKSMCPSPFFPNSSYLLPSLHRLLLSRPAWRKKNRETDLAC